MQPQPQPQQPKKKANPVAGLVFLFAIAAIAAICGIAAFSGGDDKPVDPVTANNATSAEVMCEQFIERRLKAPATAEYTDPKTSKDGATYTVRGAVDSENSFGAKIRSPYTCVVTDNSDDTWTLVDLKLSE